MPVTNGLHRARMNVALALLSFAMLAFVPSVKAQERNYLIEVIILENLFEAKEASPGPLYYPSNLGAISLGGSTAASLRFAQLDGAYILANEAEKIRGSRGFRVLKHFAWRQPGLDAKNAKAIRLKMGDTMPMYLPDDTSQYPRFIPASAQPEPSRTQKITTTTINGSLKVRLGRYLHLDTQLVFTDTENKLSYRLSQSRKMRSKELHYIDNARFGLLVKIIPLEESAN